MKKTLYDLLGVRRDASRAEIERAYEQMKSMYGGAGGAAAAARDGCSMQLIEDAYATLSSPPRREAYDASLQRAAQSAMRARAAQAMEEEPRASGKAKWVLLLVVVLLAGGWYLKASSDAKQQRERAEAELRRLEVERLATEAEAARLRAEAEREAHARAVEEQRTAREHQRSFAYSSAYNNAMVSAEHRRQENERRQAEREKQRQESMERQAQQRELYQRQMRDAQDRRYLDQFKPGLNLGN
jgi:curved DNA-binding protein CbpA